MPTFIKAKKGVTSMENGQKAIRNLFEGRKIFNIPKYQRAYAWEFRQLNDFLNDIKNQNPEKDYFLGTILFQEQGMDGEFEIIDIVDGQQRITTLIIFIKILLDKLKEYGEDIGIVEETYIRYRNEFKLRTLAHDNDFFKSYILENNESNLTPTNTNSQKRLLNAKKFFNDNLANNNLFFLKELKYKVEKAKILTYSVNNDAEATLIFETTNDRGKALTSLEKIKSFLMYKIYLVADEPDTHLDTIQTRFSEIYRTYETLEEYKYDEDSIMRYHFIAFEEWKSSKERNDYDRHLWTIKNKINYLAFNEDKVVATSFIDKYSKELKETFNTIKSILFSEDDNLIDISYLRRLGKFWPLLIKAYKFDNTENKENFSTIARLLEIISFRVYGIRRRRETTARDRLFKLAQDFIGNFAALSNELKDIIGQYCSDQDFKARLLSTSFYDDVPSNEQIYLLWKYENYIRESKRPFDKKIGFRRYGKLSIEHIVPQTPRNIPSWMNDDFSETHLHSLGNLTLDIQSENASKSNRDFEYKYSEYYRTSPFRCQNELREFLTPSSGEWDIKSIDKRKYKIVSFAMEHWDYRNIRITETFDFLDFDFLNLDTP